MLPREEPDSCSKESPTHPISKGNLAGTGSSFWPQAPWWNTMLLSNECQAAALQLSAGKGEHNSFLKPAEKFSFGTWRLLLPDQPLGHAHCWQSQQDNRGTTLYHPKYSRRLSLAHPDTLYSSPNTSDALRVIMSVNLSKHFTAEWTHPDNL